MTLLCVNWLPSFYNSLIFRFFFYQLFLRLSQHFFFPLYRLSPTQKKKKRQLEEKQTSNKEEKSKGKSRVMPIQ